MKIREGGTGYQAIDRARGGKSHWSVFKGRKTVPGEGAYVRKNCAGEGRKGKMVWSLRKVYYSVESGVARSIHLFELGGGGGVEWGKDPHVLLRR